MVVDKYKQEYESVLSSYYEHEGVTAIITIKVDTKEADNIASKIAQFDFIEQVFLVTGDTDIVLKASFDNYEHLKKFVLNSLSSLNGIKDTKTLMIVTVYKDEHLPKREVK